MSWTPDKEARHQEGRAEDAEARAERLQDRLSQVIAATGQERNYFEARAEVAEARVAKLQAALTEVGTSIFPDDGNYDYIQHVIQDALEH